MFVEAHATLPFPVDAARAALDRAMADGGLVGESHRAFAEGLAFLMRVGPRGGHGVSKQVLVSVLEPRQVKATLVVPLRWEATGASGRLFPSLDANLGLTAAGDTATVLSLHGRYEPPLGAVGSTLDRALLSRTAEATAEALVREIGEKLGRLTHDGRVAGVSGGRDAAPMR